MKEVAWFFNNPPRASTWHFCQVSSTYSTVLVYTSRLGVALWKRNIPRKTEQTWSAKTLLTTREMIQMKNVTPRGIYAHSSSLKTVLKLALRKGVIFHVFHASGGNRKASPKCKTSLLRTNLLPLLKISDYHNAHFILFHFYRNLRFKKGRRVETRLLRNSRKFSGIIGYNRFLNDPSRRLQDEIPKNFQKISGVYRIPHSNSHVSPRARASISAMLNSSVLSVFVSMFPCQ